LRNGNFVHRGEYVGDDDVVIMVASKLGGFGDEDSLLEEVVHGEKKHLSLEKVSGAELGTLRSMQARRQHRHWGFALQRHLQPRASELRNT
jgi:hypothetical protein